MKALILAAGQGRRLWPFTEDRPKCLLRLDGISILQHQLGLLERIEVEEVVLICGFAADRIHRAVSLHSGRLHVKPLFNPFYAMSDNLISLWSARSEMDDDFLLLNGDGIFHPDILRRLARSEEDCCLMVTRRDSYDPDDMKVQLHRQRLIKIGKHLSPEETDAASVGAMRFSRIGARQLCQALEEIVYAPTAIRAHFPDAIQLLADTGHPIACRETGRLPWVDVDTPEDLHFVRRNLHLFDGASSLYGKVRERV